MQKQLDLDYNDYPLGISIILTINWLYLYLRCASSLPKNKILSTKKASLMTCFSSGSLVRAHSDVPAVSSPRILARKPFAGLSSTHSRALHKALVTCSVTH